MTEESAPGAVPAASTDGGAQPGPGASRGPTLNVAELFTIQIIEDGSVVFPPVITLAMRIDALMAEAEENLTDLLPAGYRARIRRWDHPDEPTQEDNDE